MKDMNPTLEMYFDLETGEQLKLNDYIKDTAEALSSEYIIKFGFPPSKEMIMNWMKRLKRAYFKCEVVSYAG